jgi:hypothetical protein
MAHAPESRRPHRWRRLITRSLAAGIAACIGLPALALAPAAAAHAAPAVEFDAPDEIAADYYGALLRHTRWVDSVWDASRGAYQLKDFNFAVVLGNAVLLTHGDYDETLAGISKAELRTKTLATITHYAASNRFVDPNGTWGKKLFWDSTFQSYFLDAGRLLWDELDAQTQRNLTTIATGQSNYTADLDYGNDPLSGSWTADWPTGKHDGDTAQEEAGVYTQALAPGLAWAPDSPDAARWADQLGDWGRNAAGQPTADLNNPAVVAGKPISTNTMQTIHDTYLVENHGSFGPHYQSDIWRSGGRNAIHFILNDQPIPEILTRQPNSAELWESIKLVMSNQGEPFMPMVADREFLYGRDVLPIAFLGQVLRDSDAVRAEANLAAALEDYQAYAPVDRLTKFSGEPKYEPEARAEIAISYLLHVEAAESEEGPVQPTDQDEFFERLSGVRDFGQVPGLTVQQSPEAWAAASSRPGFLKFPWVPGHDSWLFGVSGSTPFMYPTTGAKVDARQTATYTDPRDGFEGTASMFQIGSGYAGQVTLPSGEAIYASSGAGADDGSVEVRNLDMNGYAGLDGSRTYTTAEGTATEALPVTRPADPADAKAARIDDLEFEPVDARYVRIQGQQGNARYGYSLYSLHAYGPDAASAADLAAGKPATASSEDAGAGRQASRVTDTDPNSRWAVSTADRTRADSWIQVDLGEEHTVGAVRLAWEASAGERYLVQTSSDGESWTTRTAYSGAADANVSRLDLVDLTPPGASAPAPVTTRFVRMQGVQGDPAYGYSLYHLRAFTAQGVDVARGKPATASSADGANAANAVTDGQANTRWAVSRGDRTRADSWVQVDLGAPTEIAQVQLGWESAAGREYRIQTSLDGTVWEDAASFRYTGDQIVSTTGSWLSVEDQAGFVVRGSDAPITVSREEDTVHKVRLGDRNTSPFLVEMVPGDAAATAAQQQRPTPTTDHAGVLASSIGGYLSLFNLTGDEAATTVTVPYTGDAVSLFAGDQRFGETSSSVDVTIPAGTAMVLAPRATVPQAAVASGALSVDVQNARTLELTAAAPASVDVTNLETGEVRKIELADAGSVELMHFAGATPFPVADLALSTLAFPASVLPEGMTSPGLAVDGDPGTSWTPGPGGRMVTDLGASREIGTVVTVWDEADAPASTISTSEDGVHFTDLAPADAGSARAAVAAVTTARYVAITTDWEAGDAALAALKVLPPGVVDDAAPGAITGDLPRWTVGEAAAGTLQSVGSPSPRFAVIAGALPAGVSLDATTGEFSGVPAEAGAFTFTVAAANGVGPQAERVFTGEVFAAGTPGEPGNPGEPGTPGNPGGPGTPDVPGTPDGDTADGGLAFTGFGVAGIVAAALLLLALGGGALLMRRRTARASD